MFISSSLVVMITDGAESIPAFSDDYYIDERVVDVHIRRLRRKIEDDPSQSRIVLTVRGAGYRVEEHPS